MAINSKKRKFLATSLTATMVAAAVAPAAGFAAEADKGFSDVPANTPYADPINKLAAAGVVTGYDDGTFKIRGKVTRAEAATMFTNIRDLDTNVANAPFADVKQGVWYSDAINAAYAAGVIAGNPDGTFAPNGELTRAEFAVMVVNAYGLDIKTDVELPFTDVKEDAWYTKYIKTLYANDLIAGKTASTFAPGENVDRGDFAILLAKTDINHGFKLQPVEEAELKVESVSAIDLTTVEVKITALKEDLFNATIEVIDNKGNVVEVKPVDIAAGDTTVFFEFAKAVEKQEGVWKIAGIEYDFDLVANLAAFENATEQLVLQKVLSDLGIVNVKTDNFPAYVLKKVDFLNELAKDKKELSVELIQGFIDKVNAETISDADSKAIAKTVNDAIEAKNDIALLAALQNDAFLRVNADWLTIVGGYKAAIDGADAGTVKEIQDLINGVNNGKVTALDNTGVDKKVLNENKELITKYATPTDKGEQTQDTKAALKAIDVQLAVADVLAATTPTTLKARVAALATLVNDPAQLDIKDYVDTNGKDYITQIKTSAPTNVADVKTAIGTVNAAAETAFLTAVTEATDAAGLLTALKAFPGLKNVADSNKDFYWAETDETAPGANDGTVNDNFSGVINLATTQTAVDAANLGAVKGADTADKLVVALKVLGVKNIVDANKAAYDDADFSTATGLEDVQASVDEVNMVVAVNGAKTAAAARTALAPVALATAASSDYLELTAAAKLEVAELFLAVKAEDRTNLTDGKYTAVADIKADLENVTGDYKGLLDAVNAATAIATMKDALGDLGIEAFDNLDAAAQLDTAETFLNAFPVDKSDVRVPYSTFAAIKAALGL